MKRRLALTWFLVKCFAILLAIRTLLAMGQYNRIVAAIARIPTGSIATDYENRKVAWGVSKAADWLPWLSCLTQALTASFLLARRGRSSRVHIGVRYKDDGAFGAHAWCESNKQILVGGRDEDLTTFSRLTTVVFGQ